MFTSRLSDYYQIILAHVNIAINKAALHMCENTMMRDCYARVRIMYINNSVS